jgi:phosphoadenosine phosphosulfate reductase
VEEAELAVLRFVRGGDCYAGVSWGKDSTVLADLVVRWASAVPIVWVRVEPITNPDCGAVRDAFLARYPNAPYEEIEVSCRRDEAGEFHASGTLEAGFRQAAVKFGRRYLSGIRAEESAGRARRALLGAETLHTCAPLIHWTAREVFAYLAHYDLPIHPAYAMTFGGALDRARIRVASLGGKRGTGTGRAEWEAAYYPREQSHG